MTEYFDILRRQEAFDNTEPTILQVFYQFETKKFRIFPRHPYRFEYDNGIFVYEYDLPSDRTPEEELENLRIHKKEVFNAFMNEYHVKILEVLE